MKIQCQNLLVKTALWLILEIILTLLGLDNLADYGEFVFGRGCTAESCMKPLNIVLIREK